MLTLHDALSLQLDDRIYRDGQAWTVVGFNMHNRSYSPAPIIKSGRGEVITLDCWDWDNFSMEENHG